jgi:RNA polymerase sigma factor (sigma-70 family)
MQQEYETLKDYLLIAKKTISKFAPKFYVGLAKEMLKSEDAVSQVATAIMEADWKWNPNYRSKNNTVRSKRAYRNQKAIWAIQAYISQKKKKKYTMSLSYETTVDDGKSTLLSGLLEDKKSLNPASVIAEIDNKEYVKTLISDLLNAGILTDRQKDYISSYYLENKTMQEVGNQFGVTREAVRQGINNGINTLKELI